MATAPTATGASQSSHPYAPFTFEVPPVPMDEITDPLPAEQRETTKHQKQVEEELRENRVKARVEAAKSEGGFLNKCSAIGTDLVSKAEHASKATVAFQDEQTTKIAEEHAAKRFARACPSIASSDSVQAVCGECGHGRSIQCFGWSGA